MALCVRSGSPAGAAQVPRVDKRICIVISRPLQAPHRAWCVRTNGQFHRRLTMFPEISLCCDMLFVIIAWWLFKSHEMCYSETSCCYRSTAIFRHAFLSCATTFPKHGCCSHRSETWMSQPYQHGCPSHINMDVPAMTFRGRTYPFTISDFSFILFFFVLKKFSHDPRNRSVGSDGVGSDEVE